MYVFLRILIITPDIRYVIITANIRYVILIVIRNAISYFNRICFNIFGFIILFYWVRFCFNFL